jgi:hypothetical protein
MKHEYTEKQKETIRGAAMLLMAQLGRTVGDPEIQAEIALSKARARALVEKFIKHGLCD